MKEKWKEEMRRKLEGHRKAPPRGLWEGISEQMGFKPEMPVHPASRRRWYWAAAAAILVMGGIYVFLHHDSTPPALQTITEVLKKEDTTPSETDIPQPWEETPEQPMTSATMAEQPTPPATSRVLAKAHVNKNQAASEETIQEHQEPTSLVPEPERNEVEEKEKPQVEAHEGEKPPTTTDSPKKKEEKKSSDIPPSIVPVHQPSSKSGKWSMGLHASGGLLAANNSTGTAKQYYLYASSMYEAYFNKMSNGYVEYETYRSKHHLPVRIGASLQYQLNDHLSLLSGITYTWLHSEFIKESSTTDQHLHYLGVPVGVSYQLWSNRQFQCYVSGTAALAKCLNEKPWQWSVDAAAGAEYAVTQQVGLYLEPSLGYYFHDGSSLEHYYKDHPLAPSIMFGLRMHMNR